MSQVGGFFHLLYHILKFSVFSLDRINDRSVLMLVISTTELNRVLDLQVCFVDLSLSLLTIFDHLFHLFHLSFQVIELFIIFFLVLLHLLLRLVSCLLGLLFGDGTCFVVILEIFVHVMELINLSELLVFFIHDYLFLLLDGKSNVINLVVHVILNTL